MNLLNNKSSTIVTFASYDEEAVPAIVELCCSRLNDFIKSGLPIESNSVAIVKSNKILHETIVEGLAKRPYCTVAKYWARVSFSKGGTTLAINFSPFMQSVLMQVLHKTNQPI